MHRLEQRFRAHARHGMRIDVALDIGSYRGDFTRMLRGLWPAVQVWQFEADERQKRHNPEAYYALLGDQERQCEFYTVDETKAFSTGSSIYRENTEFYRDPIVMAKQMTTIDNLMRTINFSGDWSAHGLVKIDTQGSELDILRGARRFMAEHQPALLLLETSIIPYNSGAPLIGEVFAFMGQIGYRLLDVFDLHYGSDDRLIQTDLLFERQANPLGDGA